MSLEKLVAARDELTEFVSLVRNDVRLAITTGKLQPRPMLFFKSTVEEFSYIEGKGSNILRSSFNVITKNNWLFSNRWEIIDSLRTSEKFLKLEEIIGITKENMDPDGNIPREIFETFGLLVNFVQDVTIMVQPDSPCIDWSDDQIVQYFIDIWTKIPNKYYVTVELKNLIPPIKTIELTTINDAFIKIRRVEKEDLEQEFLIQEFYIGIVKPYINNHLGDLLLPSAVLQIELQTSELQNARNYIQLCLIVLRLYQPVGISIIAHRVFSNVDFKSKTTDEIIPRVEELLRSWGKMLITEDDIQVFSDFWLFIEPHISQHALDQQNSIPDFIAIAYSRYVTALLNDDSLEERTTSAIMALEALFLPEKPQTELKFRLSLYVSKTLGSIKYNSLLIKDVIGQGYDIRSTFAHGGQVSEKDKRRIENKFRSTTQFIESLLDCVRSSIIVMMTLEITKKDFIDTVEKAMLDHESEEKLNQITGRIINYIKPIAYFRNDHL